MQTITVDIINKKALSLLKGLEELQLIRLHKYQEDSKPKPSWLSLKGKMTKQNLNVIDEQLKDLREGWE